MNTQQENDNGTEAPEKTSRGSARRALAGQYAQQIKALSETELAAWAARVGITTIDGRGLTLRNQIMIAMQNPVASVVGGFRQWLKHGRCVTKGQHGSIIWVPIGRKDKETGELDEKTGFILGTVFDIGQTHEIETGEKAEVAQ
jgi:hypothetical protein